MHADTSPFLTNDEATAIIAMAKIVHGEMEWKNSPPGSKLYGASAVIYDSSGATIPGLTMELFYHRTIVPGQYKFIFTLFTLRGTKKLRSFQVEVIPPDRIKHRENGVPISGPHEHVAEAGFKVDEEANSFGEDHEKWFHYFLKKANITYNGKYGEPDPPDPQRGLFDVLL